MTFTKFDFQRHKVVAVPYRDDDPEKGQHFHVALDDFLDELRDVAANRRIAGPPAPAPLTEIVTVESEIVEKLPEETIQQIQFIAKGLDVLRSRLEELSARESVTATEANQLVTAFGSRLDATVQDRVDAAMGDMRGRIAALENRDAPQVSKQIQKLAETVHAFSGLVLSVEETVEANQGDLQRKYAEIAGHIQGVEGRVGKLANFAHGLATEIKKAAVDMEVVS